MKLLRYDVGDGPAQGFVDPDRADQIIPLRALQADYLTMLAVVAGGARALARVRGTLRTEANRIALADMRLLAPVLQPGDVVRREIDGVGAIENTVRAA